MNMDHSSARNMFLLRTLAWTVVLLQYGVAITPSKNDRGPVLRIEPPSRVEFSSISGTELRCAADGAPPPKVYWQMKKGAAASDITGLRYQRNYKDGSTLVFPPFSRAEYKQDVHDAMYQCVAINDFGSVLSREVHVKAVMKQRFSPQVYDEFVTTGNTAVLRCRLPSFAKEYVLVDAWVRSDGHVLKAVQDDQGKGRTYAVLRTGELLIHDVQAKDASWTYRCQTRHRLTGELVSSETQAKLMVTEPHASTLPRLTFSRTQVQAEEGSPVELPCVALGNPPPTYRWVKEVAGVLVPIEEEPGRVWLKYGTLMISRTERSDAGPYQCIARNSIGERRVETNFVVTAPLSVSLRPPRLELTVGQEATFSCNVTGYPIHEVSWIKDRRSLLPSDSRVRLLSRDVLHISSVRREDKGMYQCFAHNDQYSAQGSAELQIADAPPFLISVFPEKTVEPGERISMRCVATGNPVPKIIWKLDYETITRSRPRVAMSDFVADPDGHVVSYLNLTDVRTDDGGEYSCEASNDVGSSSHQARLNVIGAVFVRPMQNFTAISKKDLVLRCPYGGHPIRGIRWFKDSLHLPLDSRQKVNHTGSLHIENVARETDEGKYTCVVRHTDGQSASGSTYIKVVVSPVIEAAHMRDPLTVNEKSRTKMMCVVNEGDPPLQFRWLKNNQPFLAHGDTTVQTFEDTSIVTFKKVSSSDRGMYTCVVSNKAATANRTTHLIVNVPPQWTNEPQNMTAILGRKIWFNCAATGYPVPSVLWKKLIPAEDVADDFTWVHSSPRAHRFSNGTLTLTDVRKDDEGMYMCQAHNGHGPGLFKVIHLKVLVPPRFKENFENKIVSEGSEVVLKCTAEGDPPIDIYWKKDEINLAERPHSRYSIRQILGEQETASELMIRSTSRDEDTATFTCVATSGIGNDELSQQLVVQGVPDAPVNVTVIEEGSRSVTVRWEVPHDGNSHRTGSIVQYKADPDSSWLSSLTSQLIISGSESRATLRGLSPVTTYQLRVVAENSLGKSQPSEAINVTTAEEAPSGAPRDIQIHSTGAQSMKVSWKPPPEDTWNGQIKGYYVGYRISSFSDPYHFQKVEASPGSKDVPLSTYITGLKPFTQYDVVVKAFNSAGSGPKSSRGVGRTLETAPPTSPTLQISSASTSSIDMTWTKNGRDKTAITEYTLHYKAEGDDQFLTQKLNGKLDRYTLSRLKCGTKYSLYMTASNSLGTGEPSTPVSARTKGGAPMSPKQDAFLNVNSTSAVLHLDAWQTMGCDIRSFSIKHRLKNINQWIGGSTIKVDAIQKTYVLHPLIPGKDYVLLVTAESEAGATQNEYHFRTLYFHNATGPVSYPAYGTQGKEQPFYRNVALVIPVVVSSLVLVIIIFAVAVCLRKQSQDRREQIEYGSQRKSTCDSLMMSDISGSKKSVYSHQAKLPSHYSVPAVKKGDYAEPYVCESNGGQVNDGLFATIKRGPTRPLHVSTQQKSGLPGSST